MVDLVIIVRFLQSFWWEEFVKYEKVTARNWKNYNFLSLKYTFKIYAAAFSGSHMKESGLLDLNISVFTVPGIMVINFILLLVY
ncbi:hypothetical protein wTpre_635 [Wolbachia endosymbiont of Trichogramma pretiosum]|nr:hypothetical protein wTpre_635 [Wolbachia endosymbiont of Trichogramma pretiosum]